MKTRFSILSGDVIVTVTYKNIKSVRLKVFPTLEVKLSVPVNTPEEWITKFLQNKEIWIKEKLLIFEKTKAIEKEDHIRSGVSTRILGRQLIIRIIPSSQKKIDKTDGELCLYAAVMSTQEEIDRQFQNWWQKSSKQYFNSVMERLYPIIEKHEISKPRIMVKKMKTLWGSCSRKYERINLNYYLYKAPSPCVEYVILHELAHFLYPHHNKDFYDFITIHMPDWKERKKILDYEIVLGV